MDWSVYRGHVDCGLHCLQLVMLTVDCTVYTWSCWLWIALFTAGQAACGLDCLHLVRQPVDWTVYTWSGSLWIGLFTPSHVEYALSVCSRSCCLWIDLFSEKVDREWMARHSGHSDAASLCSADAASSSPPTRGGCTRLVSSTRYQQHACNEQGEHLTYKFLPKVPIDRTVYQGRILLRIAHLLVNCYIICKSDPHPSLGVW